MAIAAVGTLHHEVWVLGPGRALYAKPAGLSLNQAQVGHASLVV